MYDFIVNFTSYLNAAGFEIPYTAKLSRGKTFVVFAVFLANRESFPLELFAVYST